MNGLTDLEARVIAAKAKGEATCLGCGCTDSQACALGCSWILVDKRRGIGVCSGCSVVAGVVDLATRLEHPVNCSSTDGVVADERSSAIVTELARRFPSFGGGKTSAFNPVANWLQDKPPQFAAGVDIRAVVDAVLEMVGAP
jgi:hypothetical protein